MWRGDRAAECTGLENRRSESYREFESHRFRHFGVDMKREPLEYVGIVVTVVGFIWLATLLLNGS